MTKSCWSLCSGEVVIGEFDKMPTQAHPDMENAVRMKVGFNG